MLKVTTWSPDTCGCTINYSWESESDADTRIHIFHSVVRKCKAHEHLSDTKLYEVLTEENPRKNKVLGKLTEEHSQLKAAPGSAPEAIGCTWGFDDKRVLHITVPNMDLAMKMNFQDDCDKEHGTKKVKIH